MASFEFLRPGWLALLPLIPITVVWLWYRAGSASPWRRHGAAAFVERALYSVPGTGWLGWTLALSAGVLAVIALAGPSWERSLTTGMRPAHTRVVVLDLSQSMNAVDVAPSRLGMAVAKARKILERSRGMQVGITVFAGASFLVAPLTSDAETLMHHLDVMDPSLIPVQGSRPDMGLQAAAELLHRGGALTGEVILISDGYRGHRAAEEAAALREQGFPVSVIGVGTQGDVPIPTETGQPLRGLNGKVVSAPAFLGGLRTIATAGGGRFAVAGKDDSDLKNVLLPPDLWANTVDDPDRRLSVPKDGGPWLLLLVVPIAALAFRRGWFLVLPFGVPSGVLLLGLSLNSDVATAAWYDFLKGPDFRAGQALANGDAATAAQLARDPMIAGSAFYRLKRYALAVAAFEQTDTALGHYNRGNALAQMSRFHEAVAAYDQALSRDLGFNEARLNRALIVKLIEDEKAEPGRSAKGEPRRLLKDAGGNASSVPEPAGHSESQRLRAPELERSKGRSAPSSPLRAQHSTLDHQGLLRPGRVGRGGAKGGSNLWSEERKLKWLSQIPDDPGSLLRQKFRLEFEKRRYKHVQNTDRW